MNIIIRMSTFYIYKMQRDQKPTKRPPKKVSWAFIYLDNLIFIYDAYQ
jgi:hypothetical protein